MSLRGIRYFADENLLGMAQLLIRARRTDLVHPGHAQLPDVPPGATDLVWMRAVAEANLIALSRDRRIRSRPAELAEYFRLGIRSVWLGAKRDLSPSDQMDMFLRHEQRLWREAIKRGPGPWALSMTPSGLRPINLPEE